MNTVTISVGRMRNNFGGVLDRVRDAGERFIVKRRDAPLAALISVAELERLERIARERDEEILRMAKATSEGLVPVEALLDQFEALHGERLEGATDVQVAA
jgi:prevent-host-death family protein